MRELYHKIIPECIRSFVRSSLLPPVARVRELVFVAIFCRLPMKRHGDQSKVRVGFFVVYESCFQMESVFSLMQCDPVFHPEIVVIPDTARGDSHMRETYQKTYSFLYAKYGDCVVDVRNSDGTFRDVARDYDICALMNPYSGMTQEQFTIKGVAHRRVPVLFTRYFHDNGTVWSPLFNSSPELKWVSRFYVENQILADELGTQQPLLRKGGKIVISGCSKIDALSRTVRRPSPRKRILIAPHHTITTTGGVFAISNFLRLKDFVLTLPKKCPEIDWIFRPHPLLMVRMVNEGFWSGQQRDTWIADWKSTSNAIYEDGGSYLDSFANSDALIQDCGSFLPEYFYTGHPQCYVLRDRNAIDEQFVEWGKLLLSHTYKAYTEQDIIDFIENVVIAGKDPMREEREKFAKEKLMFNYPHASEAIVADIKKALGREASEK